MAAQAIVWIIGEPTKLKPVLGHKGKLAMRYQMQGGACHSAYAPRGQRHRIRRALIGSWAR